MRSPGVRVVMPREPSFEFELTRDRAPGNTLLIATADIGMAGLTAADYLVSHVGADQIGHVSTRNLPDITPFSMGRPRRPMRLYGTADGDVTVLLSEIPLPVDVADPWTDALLKWVRADGIEEITYLYGASFPHSEREHTVFHVSTDDYRDRHFADGEIGPLPGGFFDGVVAELLVRSLDGDAPPVGALVTPTHHPGPDFDASLRLLDSLRTVYGIEVDEDELRKMAEEMRQYYQELAERTRSLHGGGSPAENPEYPEDRMYM